MRYVAKLHVLDVMDTVVVSGYVFDADPGTDPDHDVSEFAYTLTGRGVSEPLEWLRINLQLALHEMSTAPRASSTRGRADGGSHTLSGLGQNRQNTVG